MLSSSVHSSRPLVDRGRNANWRGTFRRKPGRRNVRGATRPKPKRATSACNGAHRVIWMCPGGGGSRCFSVGNALTIASVASVLIEQPLQNVVPNYDAQSACEQQPSPSDPMHLLLLTRMPTHCSAAPSAQPSPTTNHVILQKTPIQVLASLPPNNRVNTPAPRRRRDLEARETPPRPVAVGCGRSSVIQPAVAEFLWVPMNSPCRMDRARSRADPTVT